MTMRSWSKGDKLSLVRVLEPKKDAGNGTLLNDNNMWTFSPKINRIIKVPSSMMSQSWMGSDFSNKDISKSTDIIDQYDHELVNTEDRDGHVYYTISSIPHEEAAVVWGKEVLTVRDDYVLMEQQFWDQDGVLVKSMNTEVVGQEGDKILLQDIFEYRQTGLSETGKVLGAFVATGAVPTFLDDLESRGIAFDRTMFTPPMNAPS